jgi:exosortase/archaeosortase family protein
MRQKKVFILILAFAAMIFMFLPLTLSLNDVLTKAVEHFGWYRSLQAVVVPEWIRLVGTILKLLGIKFAAYTDGFTANGIPAKFSWNCLGWQSLVLFLISLPFGLSGKGYTFISKLKATLIGILSLFLVNLLRIVFTVLLLVISRPLYAVVFHDYLAAAVAIAWLIVFWWFAYKFVLEERAPSL